MGSIGSAGRASSVTRTTTNILSSTVDKLNTFVQERDISERSRMYADELADILDELPIGARLYTGEKTALLGTVVDGEKLYGDHPTFYEKVDSRGQFTQWALFGSNDYSKVYSDTILKNLARGKRLGKLDIQIKLK